LKKWIVGSIIGFVVLISALEIARRSMVEEEQLPVSITAEQPQQPSETGRVYSETDLSTDQEFDQADKILDSRENSLNEAKRKTGIIVDNIKK
jgi:hypothetical protein